MNQKGSQRKKFRKIALLGLFIFPLMLVLMFFSSAYGGVIDRVSVDSNGIQANGDSGLASISADGRFVAFESLASNLVHGDTNGYQDIFVRDRQTGITERISVDSNGVQANGLSYDVSITEYVNGFETRLVHI